MDLILSIIFAITPIDESCCICYRVTNSSIIQDLCSSLLKVLSYYEEEAVEKR